MMDTSPVYKFSVGFQNIQGLHDKNGCKMQEISKEFTNDIEIIVETWGCKCDLEFPDYGVVVSMFDFHRSDRGSNPGRGGKIS